MIQWTGNIGTQWILDLCNGIVKEGCIPEDWKSSVVLPIYKGKGDSMECGLWFLQRNSIVGTCYESGERIFEHRIQQQINADDMQIGPRTLQSRSRLGSTGKSIGLMFMHCGTWMQLIGQWTCN